MPEVNKKIGSEFPVIRFVKTWKVIPEIYSIIDHIPGQFGKQCLEREQLLECSVAHGIILQTINQLYLNISIMGFLLSVFESQQDSLMPNHKCHSIELCSLKALEVRKLMPTRWKIPSLLCFSNVWLEVGGSDWLRLRLEAVQEFC